MFLCTFKFSLTHNKKTSMKKTIAFSLGLVLSLSSFATLRTVCNGPITAGQFTDVQSAITASAFGDTIYVHGSATSYGNITLNKRLVLIGAGHTPSGTQYNLQTLFGTIILNQSSSTTLPTGSIIKGISCYSIGGSGSGGTTQVNNITIERCYFSGYVSFIGNGWIFRNNFSGYLSLNDFNNLIISNNVFAGTVSIYTSNKPSVVITNNIFLGGGSMNDVNYASITNNFFLEPAALSSYTGTQNTWNKNIFIYADSINYKLFPPPGNTGVGNLNTVNPQFVSTIPLTIGLAASRFYDWNLLTTSLGKTYGTDGSDVGIYGGSFPMPNLTGATNIPQMVRMDIQNSVIPLNGTLNVEIKARSQK